MAIEMQQLIPSYKYPAVDFVFPYSYLITLPPPLNLKRNIFEFSAMEMFASKLMSPVDYQNYNGDKLFLSRAKL